MKSVLEIEVQNVLMVAEKRMVGNRRIVVIHLQRHRGSLGSMIPPPEDVSSVPAPAVTIADCVALAFLVMTLMTPSTALAPQRVAPGPRITSILSTSSNITSWTFQYTPENSGV